jgi:hypothetical protein
MRTAETWRPGLWRSASSRVTAAALAAAACLIDFAPGATANLPGCPGCGKRRLARILERLERRTVRRSPRMPCQRRTVLAAELGGGMASEDFPAQLAGVRVGSLVAGYRLEAQVGAGGMAVVFRARDERLGRPVALKILAPALAADPAFRRRFIAESRAAAVVDDPHIIPIYEAGESDEFTALLAVGAVGNLMCAAFSSVLDGAVGKRKSKVILSVATGLIVVGLVVLALGNADGSRGLSRGGGVVLFAASFASLLESATILARKSQLATDSGSTIAGAALRELSTNEAYSRHPVEVQPDNG